MKSDTITVILCFVVFLIAMAGLAWVEARDNKSHPKTIMEIVVTNWVEHTNSDGSMWAEGQFIQTTPKKL